MGVVVCGGWCGLGSGSGVPGRASGRGRGSVAGVGAKVWWSGGLCRPRWGLEGDGGEGLDSEASGDEGDRPGALHGGEDSSCGVQDEDDQVCGHGVVAPPGWVSPCGFPQGVVNEPQLRAAPIGCGCP